MAVRARTLGVAALAAITLSAAAPAAAYSFSVRARTLAQIYQLRGFRLVGADVVYGRQRFTQGLGLTIWDIGDLDARRRRARLPGRGPVVSWTSYLRLDHDFGAWTAGAIGAGTSAIDAIDLVPELDESTLGLDVLYGYLTVDGLAGDTLTARIGRQLVLDGFDVWALDGATLAFRPPRLPLAIEVQGGLAVRDASPVAPAAVELDGTSGADCQEYVEGPTPGTGEWRLIDRSSIIENSALAADRSLCPQRDQWMPAIGAAIETRGVPYVAARLSYRRVSSSTVGVIDAVDRLEYPDVGLYPNELGQAPERGVNAEQVAGLVRGAVRAGPVRIAPWVFARASLVHRLVDRASAGVELRLGRHLFTPEVAYRVPTWDADSIWNVFAVEPTTDVRLGWSFEDLSATGWLRRYHGADSDANAYGVEARGERAVAGRWTGLGSLVADGGYGGTRFGATVAARYLAPGDFALLGSLAAWRLAPDGDGTWWEGIAQGRATWMFDKVALHGVLETGASRYTPGLVRVLAVVDLAFEPEI